MFDFENIDNFIEFAVETCQNQSKETAFKTLTNTIENVDEQYFNEYSTALNYIQDENVLDWIESQKSKIKNITESWGQIAASNNFDWQRAEKWINYGRPLSLIALDALNFCTTNNERLNQSIWMRKINPKLIRSPKAEIIAKKITEYLEEDKVPRVKNKVNQIIKNIYD